jgi:hypothetical protein
MSKAEIIFWAAFLRPLLLVVIIYALCKWPEYVVRRYLPPCKLKRLLLRPVGFKRTTRPHAG